MSFFPMLTKELKELARSYKLLFVPLVFAILGVMQPIMMKMLPKLLETSTGNLPPGSVIQIPLPKPGDVLVGIIGQYNQMGILLLVLVVMGAIAGERASGVAATVLTKPVGRAGYLFAKAIAFFLLAAVSLLAGLGLGAYYTQVLIGTVDWNAVLMGYLLYLPNLLLVVAATLACSAILPSAVAAGGAGLVAMIILNMVPKYMGAFMNKVSPGALTEAASKAMAGAAYSPAYAATGVLVLIILLLSAGWFGLEQQEI